MSLVVRMRSELKDAMKARDAVKTGFLRYWIAQFTLGDGTEMADDQAIKKMRSVLKEAKGGPTTFKPEELELIRQYVPATLTVDQIAAALAPVADQIRSVPKDGMAMGVAMKQLAGQAVESDDVKAAITQIRS